MSSKSYIINNYFSYKISLSISDILQDWNSVTHKNTYLSSSYLQAIENSLSPALKFTYIVIYKHLQPVGLMYFQCIEVNKVKNYQNNIHRKIIRKTLHNLCGTSLVCGNFFASGTNGYYFTEDTPDDVPLYVLKNLKKSLLELKIPLKIDTIIFKEFWKYKDIEFQKKLYNNYSSFEIDVNMVLSMKSYWGNFEDYLADMTTKYRTRAKSVIKKTNNIISKEFSASEILEHKAIIHKLYLSVLKTASFNVMSFTETSFYHLKKGLKEDFIFKAYFLDDKMVAFSTSCFTEDFLDANYVGVDFKTNQKTPLYQRILYDYVKLAIKNNKKELRLGRTAEIMKSSLGAVPTEMVLYANHSNFLINKIMRPILKKIQPSNYEIRKPFKATQLN